MHEDIEAEEKELLKRKKGDVEGNLKKDIDNIVKGVKKGKDPRKVAEKSELLNPKVDRNQIQ